MKWTHDISPKKCFNTLMCIFVWVAVCQCCLHWWGRWNICKLDCSWLSQSKFNLRYFLFFLLLFYSSFGWTIFPMSANIFPSVYHKKRDLYINVSFIRAYTQYMYGIIYLFLIAHIYSCIIVILFIDKIHEHKFGFL